MVALRRQMVVNPCTYNPARVASIILANFCTGSIIISPFHGFGVYQNGKYKIVCGRVLKSEIGLIDSAFDAAFILCKDAQTLNDFLRTFLETKWEDGLSPARNLKDNPDAICFHSYFGDFGASQIRTLLMKRDERDFNVWETDKSRLDKQIYIKRIGGNEIK